MGGTPLALTWRGGGSAAALTRTPPPTYTPLSPPHAPPAAEARGPPPSPHTAAAGGRDEPSRAEPSALPAGRGRLRGGGRPLRLLAARSAPRGSRSAPPPAARPRHPACTRGDDGGGQGERAGPRSPPGREGRGWGRRGGGREAACAPPCSLPPSLSALGGERGGAAAYS